MIGNVYFVGSVNLGSYLIATPEGHILIDTDFEETVPVTRSGWRGAKSLRTDFLCTRKKPVFPFGAHCLHLLRMR